MLAERARLAADDAKHILVVKEQRCSEEIRWVRRGRRDMFHFGRGAGHGLPSLVLHRHHQPTEIASCILREL